MAGTIISTNTSSVTLTSTTSNPVSVTATISSSSGNALYGKPGATTTWTINNSGKIISKGNGGVYLGSILGTIASGTVTNSTYIYGTDYGVFIKGNALVTNVAGGTISGNNAAAISVTGVSSTVVNGGVVLSSHYAVYMNAGGSVTNLATGTITGATGVRMLTPGTVTNAGMIIGNDISAGYAAVDFVDPSSLNLLVVDPGAVFNGNVVGGSGTLELASAVSTGTLTATNFTGFNGIEFDTGAHWTLAGSSAALTGVIRGFTTTDTIDVTGFFATAASYAAGNLTLKNTANAHVTLHFSGGPFNTGTPHVTTNTTGTVLTLCYARGTRIATERGEVAVEQLREGERVYSHLDGQFVPVRWIGIRHTDCTHHPDPRKVWPVRVSAGAFEANMPRRDLFLSPNHAVYVDEVLIPVRLLVNGRSIAQVPVDEITYYHVELPRHDVLLAEGMPAESYLDVGDGSNFANGDASMRLFPDFATHSRDIVQLWEALGCAPLIVTGPKLEAARRWVNASAGAPPSDARPQRPRKCGITASEAHWN